MRHQFEADHNHKRSGMVGFYATCTCGEWRTHVTYTDWNTAVARWAQSHLAPTLNALEGNYQTMRDEAETLVRNLDTPWMRRRLNVKAIA